MNKALKVAKREYLANVAKKSFLLVTVGLPIVLLLVFSLQAYFSKEMSTRPLSRPIGFVDHSELGIQPDSLVVKFADESEARQALLQKKIDSAFIVPQDYLKTGNVSVLVNEGDIANAMNPSVVRNVLIQSLLKGVGADIRARVSNPANFNIVAVGRDGQPPNGSAFNSLAGMAFGIVLIFSIFMSAGFLQQSVVEEKENRMIEVVLSSLSARDMISGKILGLGAVALTQIAVWLAFGIALLSAGVAGALPIPAGALTVAISLPQILVYLLYFIGGFLLYGSISAGIGSLSTSMKESQQISAIIILPAVSPLWFVTAIMAEPNGIIAQAISMFPLSAPLGMIIRSGITPVPAIEIAASLLLLFASVLIAVWASAKVFRASILMYGKRPSLKEIWGCLRRA